ncbi:putative damage-inducible protein DinB [Pontibacter mucosus]|uniref:Putative damage-inducible protein DinB n=1 Tax=Pontibacter mucosus TaxID=1649266 RepID=A0A2T5YD08_9BACT|nr:DinB family protein [Pontibacter mucosus]PTX14385.1 putative damage-inducible protein DinB [Pontibacter mucosus]
MEITSVNSFLNYYTRVRERTNRVVQVIPPEHMDWAYKPGKFTIADMLRHIACIERYLYAEVAQGKPGRYSGCGKELADGYEQVLRFFEEMHQQSMEIFSSLQDKDLSRRCTTPTGGEITLWKWLRAMVEHEIHHRGQLYIYLNMLDIKTPPIFGLTSEEVQAKYREDG